MRYKRHKDPKDALRGALFAEAARLGIDHDELRNEIAPAVMRKRISMASAVELGRLVEHITGNAPRKTTPHPPPLHPPLTRGEGEGLRGEGSGKRYESSKSGLLQELEDVARERWGEGFAKSLNAFVNANREVPTHYKMLSVASLKAIKERIKEMNRKDRNELA